MEKKITFGILRETKNPPDKRVPIIPEQIIEAQKLYPNINFIVQPSNIRCYSDDEYRASGAKMSEDLSHCDVLLGVKEVDKATFLEGKNYVFFAHVAKKQAHNRGMLQEMMRKKITLIDYEYLTHPEGQRIIAFGHWAGVVGAFNGIRAEGLRSGKFNLKPAHEFHDMAEMYSVLRNIKLPPIKILITGEGRVAGGALQTFDQLKIRKVSVDDFLTQEFNEPVLCQIGPKDYVKRTDGKPFDFDFFVKHPEQHENNFTRFAKATDMLVTCHFWDNRSPRFLTPEDYKTSDFRITVIADISCDIGGPLPSTLKASTIADPFFGYNKFTGKEDKPFGSDDVVTVMSIDNLPCELPRDSSKDFGRMFIDRVIPHFLDDRFEVIQRATILKNGELTPRYQYLDAFSRGEE